MAFRRQIIDSAKFVSKDDPAIDHAACSYTEYIESGYDLEKLKAKAGEVFSVFTVAPLTGTQRQMRHAAGSAYQKQVFTVMLGLQRVENYWFVTKSGQQRELPEIKRDGKMIRAEWIDEASLPDELVEELAEAIEKISELPAPLSNA